MKTLLTIFFTVSLSLLFGQNWLPPQSIGMADIVSTMDGHAALFTNHAGLANVKGAAFMAGMENHYWWSDVNLVGMGMVLPTQSGTFGLQMR